ncbi:MAG: hypothetical protein QOG25_3165, partial [Acetobacteraceae bacterium]|nr:hypothetical protein [Acetobacteraceae bacterium]
MGDEPTEAEFNTLLALSKMT